MNEPNKANNSPLPGVENFNTQASRDGKQPEPSTPSSVGNGRSSIDMPFPSSGDTPQPLLIEPETLEGVASAYRYKLTVLNRELYGCTFNFPESDVFSFTDVNKKRAVKKEDWPVDSSVDNPARFDVRIQLMAGNAEIKTCGGCSMWKDLTEKPFLVLTPQGNSCIQFVRKPFILIIFRCCPKFHSYAKQFKLLISITSASTGTKYAATINIYRKKMNNGKKRKLGKEVESPVTPVPLPLSSNPLAGSNSMPPHPNMPQNMNPQELPNPHIQTPQQFLQYQQQYQHYQQYQQHLLAQQVVSPQLLYELLYQKSKNPPPAPFSPTFQQYPPPSMNQNQQMSLSPKLPNSPSQHPKQGFQKDFQHLPPVNQLHNPSPNMRFNYPAPNEDKWLDNFLEVEQRRVAESVRAADGAGPNNSRQ